MDKYALIEKINSIEGLTDEERDALKKLLREQKKYGLVWEDKTETVEENLRNNLPYLREVKERAIVSDSPSAPNHILIEGDNLEALTALTYTHSGKVDVIYIDPPYNTGNKDFVYNDSYIDKENAYRHSTWLSFMSKRLKIAKRLLSDRGVIFISIDDNEQAQLKLLCDEMFGGNNYIGEFSWQKRKGGGNDSAYIAIDHEYILVYANSKSKLEKVWRIPYDESYLKRYNKEDEKGKYYYDTLSRPGLNHPIIYDVKCPDGSIIKNGTWQISEKTFLDELHNGDVDFIKNKQGGYTVVHKVRFASTGRVMRSIINDYSNKDAADEMFELLGNKKAFSNPKPSELILKFVQLASKKDSIILDFFAGSGTTLHAVMQLNNKDKGNRQCILVQKNEKDENNICEEVTYIRNKRVIEGYTTPKGEYIEGLKANNLRYYKTETMPREQTIRNRRRLMEAATDLLCIKNDMYNEVDEFGGMALKKREMRCFVSGKRTMLVIYNEVLVDKVAELIRSMEVDERIMIYVFSMNSYPQTDNFCEVLDKVELCALPAAIYNAYRNVLPSREKRKKREYAIKTNEGGQNDD